MTAGIDSTKENTMTDKYTDSEFTRRLMERYKDALTALKDRPNDIIISKLEDALIAMSSRNEDINIQSLINELQDNDMKAYDALNSEIAKYIERRRGR